MPDDDWLRRFNAELEAITAQWPGERKTALTPKGREHKQSRAARERRQLFLELILGGMGRDEAVSRCGWASLNVYYRVRELWPGWAAQVDYTFAKVRELREAQGTYEVSAGTNLPFEDFVRRWFPDRNAHLPHQLRIARLLDDLEPRDVCMVLLWPEAGKTATLEDYMCRKLALDPSHRFRYVSEAADLSKRVVGTCKRRFTGEDYKPFIDRYGPFYEKGQERNGRPWTTEQIMLLTNPGGERDYNIVATSWTGANYGSRIDTVIFDDLQSQRNYNQAEDIFRRVRGTFFNRGFELRTLIIGTRIGPGDFYDRMRDAGLVTKEVILPAEDPTTGEPTHPEWWDRHTLTHKGGACCSTFRVCPRNGARLTAKEYMDLVKFQSGSDIWAAGYQQSPQANELLTFAEYLDDCLDHDRTYGPLSRTA